MVRELKNVLLICCIFLLTIGISKGEALTTEQMKDTLIFNGNKHPLSVFLLEPFFVKNPELNPSLKNDTPITTALWRGYVATFEIKDNDLYIIDIQLLKRTFLENNNIVHEWIPVFKDVFPDGLPKKINWYSGIIITPYGEIIDRNNLSYERYLLFEIKKGHIHKMRDYNHEEFIRFKEKQLSEFKKTKDYKRVSKKLKRSNKKLAKELNLKGNFSIDNYLFQFLFDYTSKFLTD